MPPHMSHSNRPENNEICIFIKAGFHAVQIEGKVVMNGKYNVDSIKYVIVK